VTERSEGAKGHAAVVTFPDEGGRVTERSEGAKGHAAMVTSPTKEGP
jgi:hypothetical protein